jgi:hypothetical protein
MDGNPWPFAASLRLSAGALLVAMVSHVVEGLTSAVLTFAAAVLALFGAMEFVHAWRWCLPQEHELGQLRRARRRERAP